MTAVLGALCAIVGTILPLPQLLRIVRAKTAAGVSLLAWQIWCGVGLAWAVHGLWARDIVVILPNGVGMLMSAGILVLVKIHRKLSFLRVWGPAVAWAVAGILVRLWIGPLAFGLAMIVPQYIAVGGQLVDVITKRDLRGVSAFYLVLGLVVQGLWCSYGLLKPDPAIVAASSAMTLISGLTLGWYVARRLGAPAWTRRWGRGVATEPSIAGETP